MFSNAIDDFLKQDNIGMKEANFSTTRYIAQLLIQKKNVFDKILDRFNKYIKK